MRPCARVVFDGVGLTADPHAPGRRLRIDARCLAGPPVKGAYAHVCALTHDDATLRFDEPEVQQARRDALAWWIPLLGEALVCVSTFAIDASLCAGASALLYILFSGLARLLARRLSPSQPVFVPFLVVIALLVPLPLFAGQSFLQLGDLTAASAALAAATLLLPLGMLFGLFRQVSMRASGAMATADAVAALAVLQWTIVLASWGLVPLRLWS